MGGRFNAASGAAATVAGGDTQIASGFTEALADGRPGAPAYDSGWRSAPAAGACDALTDTEATLVNLIFRGGGGGPTILGRGGDATRTGAMTGGGWADYEVDFIDVCATDSLDEYRLRIWRAEG